MFSTAYFINNISIIDKICTYPFFAFFSKSRRTSPSSANQKQFTSILQKLTFRFNTERIN